MAAYVCLINEDNFDHAVINLAVLASSLQAQLLMYTVEHRSLGESYFHAQVYLMVLIIQLTGETNKNCTYVAVLSYILMEYRKFWT